MPLTFIDANILFRMFAVTPLRLEKYRSSGTSGSKALDYAIKTLLDLHNGGYSTSELAILEACGVASREGGMEKTTALLKATLEQEGLSILEVKSVVYPLAFGLVLEYGFQARDSLHLGVSMVSGVTTIATSDGNFADGIEQLSVVARNTGFRIPPIVEAMYGLSQEETRLLERTGRMVLSILKVERAPS